MNGQDLTVSRLFDHVSRLIAAAQYEATQSAIRLEDGAIKLSALRDLRGGNLKPPVMPVLMCTQMLLTAYDTDSRQRCRRRDERSKTGWTLLGSHLPMGPYCANQGREYNRYLAVLFCRCCDLVSSSRLITDPGKIDVDSCMMQMR
jgi:hypothetical protein